MKKSLLFFLYSLITEGVFGESVSMEGDSVTLHTGLTEIQEKVAIEWRFGDKFLRIARIKKDSEPSIYEDVFNGTFRGRLQLNGQTGDLTITNIKTTDSGVYKVSNSINTLELLFSVAVEPADVSADAVESVSVMQGDSVTLLTDPTDIQRNVIRWKFNHQTSPVAEINRMTGIFNTYDGPDGRFRDRLQLDYQTGSLTIKNIGTKHSGLYEVEITSTSSSYTVQHTQSFSVAVRDGPKSVSVNEGDSVTLHTVTEIQNDDLTKWMFANIRLAEINKAFQQHHIYPVERFRDRLKLNNQTGSLTITNTRTTDSGLYELKISSSRRNINRRLIVTVNASGLSPDVSWIIVLLLVAAAVVAVVIYCRHKISKLKSHRRLFLAAVAEIVVVVVLGAVAVVAVIYYLHEITELESNWRSGLSPYVPWIVVLLVAAVVILVAVVILHKISEPKSNRCLFLAAVAKIVVVVVLGAVAVVAVIYYLHEITELESNWRLDPNSGLFLAAVAGIAVGGVLVAATEAVVAVIYYRHKISELESHRRLFLAAVAMIILVVLGAVAVVAVIYYLHKIAELESNWRLDPNSASGLSPDVPWIVVLLVAAVVVLAPALIRHKISKLKSHRKNGQNCQEKGTDDSAKEEIELASDQSV